MTDLTTHRVESWRVDLLSEDDSPIGVLDGCLGGEIEQNVNAIISGGGTLRMRDVGQDVDWLRARLQVWWRIGEESLAPVTLSTLGPVLRTNLIPDPRATRLWASSGVTHEVTGGPDGVSTWAKYTHPSGPSSAFLTVIMTADSVSEYAQVAPGETYTIRAHVIYSSMPDARAQPYVQWYRANGTVISSSVPSGLVPGPAGEWHETLSIVTAPAEAAFARVGMSVGRLTGPAGTYIGASKWLMTDSAGTAVGGPYFDGTTPDTPTLHHAWTGTPHASTSVQRSVSTVTVMERRWEGDVWPLGVFLPSAPVARHDATGRGWDVELLDKLVVLDQDKTDGSYSLPAGTMVTAAVQEVIASAGETRTAITASAETLTAGMVWEAGTSKLRICNDLLAAINYFSLRCDGSGRYVAAPYQAPRNRTPAWDFAAGDRAVHSATFTRDEDLAKVPNKVVLVSSASSDVPALVSVVANLDPASRFSEFARGRWIVHTETGVEATSQAVLDALAARRLTELSSATATLEIQHAFLPLALNDVVRFNTGGVDAVGVVQKTRIPLEPGGLTTTTIREVV